MPTPKTTKHHNEATQSFFSCLQDTLIAGIGKSVRLEGAIAEDKLDPEFIVTPVEVNFDAFIQNPKNGRRFWIKVYAQVDASHGNALERMYKYIPWYKHMIEHEGGKFGLVTLYQDDEAETSLNHFRLVKALEEHDRAWGSTFSTDPLFLFHSNSKESLINYSREICKYLGIRYAYNDSIW